MRNYTPVWNPPRPCAYCGEMMEAGTHGRRRYHPWCATATKRQRNLDRMKRVYWQKREGRYFPDLVVDVDTERLERLLAEYGSVEDLAGVAGVWPRTIYRVRVKGNCRASTLDAIATALNVNTASLSRP